MRRRRVQVLYEDERAEEEKNYGPHMLLLACVADRVGGDRWALRHSIDAIPKKGDGNLEKALDEEGATLGGDGPVVAMFDNDKVRLCYGLAGGACKRDVLQTIRAQAKGTPTIVLLEENMEDLVGACCVALNRPTPRTKPKPLERDGILHAAAADATARAKILAAVPSFERLVLAVLDAYMHKVLIDAGETPA